MFACFQDKKCDSVLDCDDGSDESDCSFLVVNEDYAKDKLPLVDLQEGPVKVGFFALSNLTASEAETSL